MIRNAKQALEYLENLYVIEPTYADPGTEDALQVIKDILDGMFAVRWQDTIFTAVALIKGRWIDGNTGYDVSDGEYLGLHVGARYINSQRYDYYRQGNEMYQLGPDIHAKLTWLCAWSIADKFLVGIEAFERRK